MQAGKLAPLGGPQPPFHYTRLDAQDELLCGKGYWRRAPDRVYEDSEEEDDDEAQPKCASGVLAWCTGKWLTTWGTHLACSNQAAHACLQGAPSACPLLALDPARSSAGSSSGVRAC